MSYDPPRPCAGGCGKTVRPKRYSNKAFPGTVGIIRDGKCWQCANPVEPSRQKNMVGPKIYPCEGVCGRMLRPANTPKSEHPDTVPVTKNRMCWSCNHIGKTASKPEHIFPGPDHVYAPGTSKCAGVCGRLLRSSRMKAADHPGTLPRIKAGMCGRCYAESQNQPAPTATALTHEMTYLMASREKREAEKRAREWRLENLVVTRHGVRRKTG